MEFINKNSKEAISIVSDFITGQWQTEIGRYVNIGYSDLPTKRLRKIMIDEQGNKCCYCMKTFVESEKTTIEHVIPRAIGTMVDLQQYHTVAILKDNVTLQQFFKEALVPLTMPPFPHHIAYHNMVVSCQGINVRGGSSSNFCNGFREDKYIPPFNFDPSINEKVTYLKSGTVYYENDTNTNEYINAINGNYETLVSIRRVWYFLCKSEFTLEYILSVKEQEREELLTLAIDGSSEKSKIDATLKSKFKNEEFWSTLLCYKWFYNYYKGGIINED